MTHLQDTELQEIYRSHLIEGLYSKHKSNKDFLLAKVHKNLEYPGSTDIEELDQAICGIAKENNILFVLNNMFGQDSKNEENPSQESNSS